MRKIWHIAIVATALIASLSLFVPFGFLTNVRTACAGEALETFKAILTIAQNTTGVKYFSNVVQSKKPGSTGALKITVTSKFLREKRNTRQELMQSTFNSWKQTYKGSDEPMIAFVDSKNVAVGIASGQGCLPAP